MFADTLSRDCQAMEHDIGTRVDSVILTPRQLFGRLALQAGCRRYVDASLSVCAVLAEGLSDDANAAGLGKKQRNQSTVSRFQVCFGVQKRNGWATVGPTVLGVVGFGRGGVCATELLQMRRAGTHPLSSPAMWSASIPEA